mgnify:CR=1 FL=1|tara:strand:- start:4917 stop:6782 length:1866 start_codon:yes stop_codon:yes gene_type:complete
MAKTFYNPYERAPISTDSNDLESNKFIGGIALDFSDIKSSGEKRKFVISGDIGAEFTLEIKNEDSYYYNFFTKSFQAEKANLEKSITSGGYEGFVTFPAITDDDQYDVYLFAKLGTRHVEYQEIRFADGSIDINSSTGSNSLLLQKVIYQYSALTLTLQGYSPSSTILGTFSTNTLSVERGKNKNTTSFSLTAVANAANSYGIIRQPSPGDALCYIDLTVESDPEVLPGENEYPTATTTFTGDDVNGAITSGSVVRIDGSTSANITVGDKITTATTTGTVNGNIEDGEVVTIEETASAIMAVGDQVFGSGADGSGTILEVTVVGTGGNPNRFTVSESTSFVDAATLTFSSKVNRSLTTVTVVGTSGVDTDFTMSQTIQFRDNAPLTFTPRKNRRWAIDDISKISVNDKLLIDTNIVADSIVSDYKDIVTINADTEKEEEIIKSEIPALETKGKKPTITKGVLTVQPGSVIFNNQQALAFGGKTIKIAGYGEEAILNASGYNLLFTNLKVELTSITTTTTSAVSSSTTVPVASVNGVLPATTTVSGIGINSYAVDPTVNSRSVTSGAGNLELSAAQTLESGVTLTYNNSGQTATITGNVQVIKAGTSSKTIYFDVEKILSTV